MKYFLKITRITSYLAFGKKKNLFAYAIFDISLGFFGISQYFNSTFLLAEIKRINSKEILYSENF